MWLVLATARCTPCGLNQGWPRGQGQRLNLRLTTLNVTGGALASPQGHSLQRHSPVDECSRPYAEPIQSAPRKLQAESARPTHGWIPNPENATSVLVQTTPRPAPATRCSGPGTDKSPTTRHELFHLLLGLTPEQGDGETTSQSFLKSPLRAIAKHQQRKTKTVEGFHHKIHPLSTELVPLPQSMQLPANQRAQNTPS